MEPARKKTKKSRHLEPEAPPPPSAPAQPLSSSIPAGLGAAHLPPFDIASFLAFQQWQAFCKQFQPFSPYAAEGLQGPAAVLPQPFQVHRLHTTQGPSSAGATARRSVQRPPASTIVEPPCDDPSDFLDSDEDWEDDAPGCSPLLHSSSGSDEEGQAEAPPSGTPATGAPTVDSHPPSLSENYNAYPQLVRRMAEVLDLAVVPPSLSKSDKVFEDMVKDQLAPTKLAFVPSLLSLAKETWAKPSVPLQVPRRAEKLYKIHGDDTEFLQLHPTPNSWVVDVSQPTTRAGANLVPSDKEGKKLDALGRRQYSFAAFALRVANYLAAMGAYHRHLWNLALPALNAAPEDLKTAALASHQEALSLACQEREAARHLVDVSSKQLITAVALRRHAWLRSANLTEDVKALVEDLPFDGKGLFDPTTDDVLKNLIGHRKIAKALAVPSTSKGTRHEPRKVHFGAYPNRYLHRRRFGYGLRPRLRPRQLHPENSSAAAPLHSRRRSPL